MDSSLTIGFIGQGFIGKNMADDIEDRGYRVVRYALEKPYNENKDAIAACDIVFIAIPTPTTPKGFDASGLHKVLPLIGMGKVAVIKSTILPGTTEALQKKFPKIMIMHSPEFLREKTAVDDTRNPARNIIGIPKRTKAYEEAATRVLGVLPKAPYEKVMGSKEAELVKYGGNTFLMMKLVYMNTLYDLARAIKADYGLVAEAMGADDRIGPGHTQIIDSSGHKGAKKGRGAGGHCFPKDLAALAPFYKKMTKDAYGAAFLSAIEHKNNALLCGAKKDMDLLIGVYGEKALKKYRSGK